jgi:phosphoglycerate dehydrogenase-like enzyme
MNAAFLTKDDCEHIGTIFDDERRQRITRSAELYPVILTPENFLKNRAAAARAEVVFSCWGFPDELVTPEHFPALKILFHTGGTVKAFAGDLLRRGVQVVSARAANAIPVSQFCLAQIILSCKGYFRNTRMCRDAANMHAFSCFTGPGTYREKIALLGMGAVARELARLLRSFELQILVVDPYLAAAEATELGVEVVSLERAFAEAYVVSNHLPNLPELSRVLTGKHFRSMRGDATFINTGRGAQVNETDLIDVARERSDLMFLLDVSAPEPPEAGSPFFELPNVQFSSHIAGALTNEWHRLGDLVIGDFERYVAGKPLQHAFSLDDLDRLA